MRKCNFKKTFFNFIDITFWHVYFPVNLLLTLRTPFCKDTFKGLRLDHRIQQL